MKIIIDYDSSWRNSFLDGSNNEPLPKAGRKFIGSMTNLKKAENFISHEEIKLDTVMGILNRLIGDQRKLYQSRNDEHYYFKDLEPVIRFEDVKSKQILTSEITYIRNITGSTDQNSFTGMIKVKDVMFQSDYSQELWGVLGLAFDELCEFIVSANTVESQIEVDPIIICGYFDSLGKLKVVENEGRVTDALAVLDKHFAGTSYQNNKGLVVPSMLYCSALYLQLERLGKRFDTSSAVTKTGVISGISKRGFTQKDFMNRFTTGEKKKIWGNPYIRKERIKGEGEVVSKMTKACGQLEIEIPTDREKAKEISTMILNAGVSSFYLGKKGLAYVSDIR